MNVKHMYLAITTIFLLFGCASNMELAANGINYKNITLLVREYSRYSVRGGGVFPPEGTEFLTLRIEIINKSNSDYQIDFDDIYLIDNKQNKLRVEFLKGKRHDDMGRIFWTSPALSRNFKTVTFLIPTENDFTLLRYRDEETKLIARKS